MSDDPRRKRLLWRCRRGMKELDQLMLRYLETRWDDADPVDQQRFDDLLDCEDDQLWRWFLGREPIDNPEHRAIVQRILELA